MPPIPVPDHQVQLLLNRWFPQNGFTMERMEAGSSTPVYRVTSDNDVFFLRLAEIPGEHRDAEVHVHQLARQRGVSVPAVLRYESQPPELDRSAALTAVMPGIPLADYQGDPTSVLITAAADLARLNQIPVQGYGWADEVDTGGRYLVATHPTRQAWTHEYHYAVTTISQAGILPGNHLITLRAAMDAWLVLPGADPSRLAHGDFDPSHMYVDPAAGTYQGMIDLGEIRGADLAYDLGHFLAHAFDERGERMAQTLIAAYRSHAPIDDVTIRQQAIAIATRALAIQLERPASIYRAHLITRLTGLLAEGARTR